MHGSSRKKGIDCSWKNFSGVVATCTQAGSKRTADLTFWEKLHIVGAPDQRNTTTSNQRTTTFVFQSKMQRIGENISIAWFPSTNSWLIDPPTQNRSGSISWGPLTGENPRPCYYGQSVRRVSDHPPL